MFQRMFRQVALCGAFALLTSSASAQYFPGSSFDPCAPARPVASLGFAPVASTSFAAAPISASLQQQCVTTCQPAPLVPVAQQCYQTVPTVEYQEVKRTVERPVVETRYVDQTYTAYRPVSESRVAEVPTVNYQNVTEYQTVTRDQGQWVSHRECIQRPLPCQYDNRPGFGRHESVRVFLAIGLYTQFPHPSRIYSQLCGPNGSRNSASCNSRNPSSDL